jgi:hypothetical protein
VPCWYSIPEISGFWSLGVELDVLRADRRDGQELPQLRHRIERLIYARLK